MLSMKYCFDLDGTLCTQRNRDYENAIPIKKNIKKVNELYNKGNTIIIFTARYMGRTNENKDEAIKLGYKFTEKQINSWGIKYHKLIFGKPLYDIIIDDKAIFFDKNWSKFL